MLPTGKLQHDLLRRLLAGGDTSPDVLLGPGAGLDAAVIDLGGDELLLAAADPITFVSDRAARFALAVNANDIAVMGGTPRWFLATILLPEGSSEQIVETLFEELRTQCSLFAVSLVGGHTEITPAVVHPVIAGTMLGTVERRSLLTAADAADGDDIWLAGALAIEGTAILCRQAAGELLTAGVSEATLAAGRKLLDEPGISVVPVARLAAGAGVSAMHDPTEGGLDGALWEMAEASGRDFVIDGDDIPVIEESRIVCAALGLDPRGLLASGALLIAASPRCRDGLGAAFSSSSVPLARIGKVAGQSQGRISDGKGNDILRPERDQLAAYLDRQP